MNLGKPKYKIGDVVEFHRWESYSPEHTKFAEENNYKGIIEHITKSPLGLCWHYKMVGFSGQWGETCIIKPIIDPIDTRFEILDL